MLTFEEAMTKIRDEGKKCLDKFDLTEEVANSQQTYQFMASIMLAAVVHGDFDTSRLMRAAFLAGVKVGIEMEKNG